MSNEQNSELIIKSNLNKLIVALKNSKLDNDGLNYDINDFLEHKINEQKSFVEKFKNTISYSHCSSEVTSSLLYDIENRVDNNATCDLEFKNRVVSNLKKLNFLNHQADRMIQIYNESKIVENQINDTIMKYLEEHNL